MTRNILNLMMVLLIVVVIGITGCGGGGGGGGNPPNNKITAADAGLAQNVLVGSLVTLDGSSSTGADGSLITYQWKFTVKPVGSSAALSNTTVVKPTFTPDVAGVYVINLDVNDGKVNAAATVTITASVASVANSAPVANAGPAQNVVTGIVILDGSGSSDADRDQLTYSWSFTSKPNGSSAALSISNANIAKPTFTADVAGVYALNLVVNDGKANGAAATVIITATAPSANAAPVANAGPAQSVVIGAVILDGSGSSDANGDPLRYSWAFTSKPDGSSAALASATVVHPTFTADLAGDYVLNLVVNDGTVNSAAATVTIAASAANAAPVANAGTNQHVMTGGLANLDGGKSSDANNEALSYKWAFTSKPAGSTAEISGSTTSLPTFIPDVDGSYIVKLIVNDGELDSSGSVITIESINKMQFQFYTLINAEIINGYLPANTALNSSIVNISNESFLLTKLELTNGGIVVWSSDVMNHQLANGQKEGLVISNYSPTLYLGFVAKYYLTDPVSRENFVVTCRL